MADNVAGPLLDVAEAARRSRPGFSNEKERTGTGAIDLALAALATAMEAGVPAIVRTLCALIPGLAFVTISVGSTTVQICSSRL